MTKIDMYGLLDPDFWKASLCLTGGYKPILRYVSRAHLTRICPLEYHDKATCRDAAKKRPPIEKIEALLDLPDGEYTVVELAEEVDVCAYNLGELFRAMGVVRDRRVQLDQFKELAERVLAA